MHSYSFALSCRPFGESACPVRNTLASGSDPSAPSPAFPMASDLGGLITSFVTLSKSATLSLILDSSP